MLSANGALDDLLLRASEMGKAETVVEKLKQVGHGLTIAAQLRARKRARLLRDFLQLPLRCLPHP